MTTLVEKALYFERAEEKNTDEVLRLVKEYAERNRIKSIIIASTRGYTARKAVEILDTSKFNLVIVTHVCWFKEGLKQEFDSELRKELEARGVKIITATHALGGVNRALEKEFGGVTPEGIIAETLRLFCEGVKVAVEITLMATDAGAVDEGEEVVAVAGTGRGADTALVLTAATSRNLFDLKIRKILAKPIF